ncbi:unnamed protein product, partial [Timema podura]|nr:unnamed protein product [Timema podura]
RSLLNLPPYQSLVQFLHFLQHLGKLWSGDDGGGVGVETVWSLSRSYGLVPYVPDSIHSALKNVFTHLRIPPLSKLNSLDRCLVPNKITLNTTIYDFSNLEKTLRNMNESEEPIVLRKYIVLVESIVPFIGELKEEFKYQPVYINIAQARLQRARAIMNGKHGNREVTSWDGQIKQRSDWSVLVT